MIKNLLNADEDPPPGTKVIIEDTIVDSPPENAARDETPENLKTPPDAEASADAKFFTGSPEAAGTVPKNEEPSQIAAEPPAETKPLDENAESLSALMADIENLDDQDLDVLEKRLADAAGKESLAEPQTSEPVDAAAQKPPAAEPLEARKTSDLTPSVTLFRSEEKPRQSMAETIRQSGLAYSAAIVLFGSIVFTMLLGWFADLLLGTSPWGIVGGIILGGFIGFIQFFRITSQIFKK